MRIRALLPFAAVLALTACGDDPANQTGSTNTSPSTTTTAPATPTSPSTAPATPTTPPPANNAAPGTPARP